MKIHKERERSAANTRASAINEEGGVGVEKELREEEKETKKRIGLNLTSRFGRFQKRKVKEEDNETQ